MPKATVIEADVEKAKRDISASELWVVLGYYPNLRRWEPYATRRTEKQAAMAARGTISPTAIVHIHIPAMDY